MSFAADFPATSADRALGVAQMIDISAVQAAHGRAQVEQLASLSTAGRFIAAHVLPSWVPTLAPLLAGSSTHVGSPVGFPSGGTSTEVKCFEADWLITAGVQEMDIVMNIGLLTGEEYRAAAADLRAVLETVDKRVPVKVILEVGRLGDGQLERAAETALAAGATSLKTGTGWSGVATTPEDVARIHAIAGPDVEIKASGGVRTLRDLEGLYDAGARRFGANVASAQRIIDQTNEA